MLLIFCHVISCQELLIGKSHVKAVAQHPGPTTRYQLAIQGLPRMTLEQLTEQAAQVQSQEGV